MRAISISVLLGPKSTLGFLEDGVREKYINTNSLPIQMKAVK